MSIQNIFTTIAISIALIAYVPYIKDTLSGKTKPHAFSWTIWTVVSFLSFGIQLANNGGAGSLVNLLIGLLCTFIAIQGFVKGYTQIKAIDYLSIILSIVALILWIIVKQPTISVVLIILVDFFSFIPTIIKSWSNPQQETFVTWLLSIFRHIFTIASLSTISFLTAGYTIYALIINILFCALLLSRKTI